MKKLLSLLIIFTLVTTFYACKDDETPNLASPTFTIPTPGDVEVGGTATIDFAYTAAAGFASSTVAATGGTAVIATDGTAGATSGTISVTFTAGTTPGAGSVTLTVTDNEGDVNSATAVFDVAAEVLVFTVSSNITANTTWETGKTYILGGRITVLDGATLTIEAGTVIKGQAGTGANATALLVARGGRLVAEGTAAAPIIFTSVADELTPADVAAGNFGSPNLDPDINGLWGGIIILGDGFISASAAEVQIDGIPPSDTNGLYGGNDFTNDAGSISYISIRHGGTNIGAGNEINGLTLGGVGSGTTISNVEIVANQDDGIEWFGGDVSVTNAVVWNAGDDGMDTDQGWNGTMNDFIVVNPSGSCFELDGPEGNDADYFASSRSPLKHTFINGTVYVGASPALVDFDADGNVDIQNTYFFGIENASGAPVQEYQLMIDGAIGSGSMTGIQVTLPAGKSVAEIFVDVPAENITTVAANANTVGSSADYSWTWASQSGALAGIGVE